MPQYEELWAQNVPVSGAVDPVCPSVRNYGPSMFLAEATVTSYLNQLVLTACQRVRKGQQHNVATADCSVSINHRTCGKSVMDITTRSCAQLLLHFSLHHNVAGESRSRCCTTCVGHVKLCDFTCDCD